MRKGIYESSHSTWYGSFDRESVERVAELLREQFVGKKVSVFTIGATKVAGEERRFFEPWTPTVQIGVEFEEIRVYDGPDDPAEHVGIGWAAGNYVYGLHGDEYLHAEYKNGWQLFVEHYAPAGNRLWWVFAVEAGQDED